MASQLSLLRVTRTQKVKFLLHDSHVEKYGEVIRTDLKIISINT